jgi:N-acetylmuramoyl-L-alanine amidase
MSSERKSRMMRRRARPGRTRVAGLLAVFVAGLTGCAAVRGIARLTGSRPSPSPASSAANIRCRRQHRGGRCIPVRSLRGLGVRTDLGGLNPSAVPKVFIECGNMRRAADAARLTSPRFRQRVAVALAAGFTAFLNRHS